MRDKIRKHLRRDEGGASTVEYGLLVAFIAAFIVASVMLLGAATNGLLSEPCTAYNNATGSSSC